MPLRLAPLLLPFAILRGARIPRSAYNRHYPKPSPSEANTPPLPGGKAPRPSGGNLGSRALKRELGVPPSLALKLPGEGGARGAVQLAWAPLGRTSSSTSLAIGCSISCCVAFAWFPTVCRGSAASGTSLPLPVVSLGCHGGWRQRKVPGIRL